MEYLFARNVIQDLSVMQSDTFWHGSRLALQGTASSLILTISVEIDCRVPRHMESVLFYHDPVKGLEGKFSLEYVLARALIDGPPKIDDFTDSRVNEPRCEENWFARSGGTLLTLSPAHSEPRNLS